MSYGRPGHYRGGADRADYEYKMRTWPWHAPLGEQIAKTRADLQWERRELTLRGALMSERDRAECRRQIAVLTDKLAWLQQSAGEIREAAE